MRRITEEQFLQEARGLLEAVQQENVLVTRNGEPYAMILGMEYKDEEDLMLQLSPAFWRMIEERRREPKESGVPLETVMAELFPEDEAVAIPDDSVRNP